MIIKQITIDDVKNNDKCRELVEAYNQILLYFGEFFKKEGTPTLSFSTGTANCLKDLLVMPGVQIIQTVDYKDLNIPAPSVEGHAGKLHLIRMAEALAFFCEGRVQLSDGFTAEEVVRLTCALGLLGVKKSIFFNASGSCSEKYAKGDFVLVSDHINYSGQSPLCENGTIFSDSFVGMTNVYSKPAQDCLKKIAGDRKIPIKDSAIYALTTPPGKQFETPAEVRKFARDGVDLLGMSSVLEMTLCKKMNIEATVVSVVTNEAAKEGNHIDHLENLDVVKTCGPSLALLVYDFACLQVTTARV